MKKLLISLTITGTLLLGACGNKEKVEPAPEVEEVKLKSEIDNLLADIYMKEISMRLLEAAKEEDGSFTQQKTLQAGIAKAESIIEILNTEYEKGNPQIEALQLLAEIAIRAQDDAVGGQYNRVNEGIMDLQEMIYEFYSLYRDEEPQQWYKAMSFFTL